MGVTDPYLKRLVKLYRDFTEGERSEEEATEIIMGILSELNMQWGDDL